MDSMEIIEKSRFKLGMHQANRWFQFLMHSHTEDVESEIKLAELQSKGKSIREFNNQVNRNLHNFARNNGYRRTNPITCKKDIIYGVAQYIKMDLHFTEFQLKKII